jgi:ribosomal protein S18 acetylase RimI-like enzyme
MTPENLTKRLKKKYGEILHTLYLDRVTFTPSPLLDLQAFTAISITLLIIEEEYRGNGWGTAIMDDVCAYADAQSCMLVLHPGFNTKKTNTRLVKFYERFGFVKLQHSRRDSAGGITLYRAPR